nr:putative ribonuclease H-like domain-containing protein [Tanacetum cinerariifolium]
LARKNELKARGTLLMALPDKHYLKFNTHKDAKTLMEALEKRFRGNTKTKKVQKTLLKQQYENFTGFSFESLDQIHDRLQKLISQLKILGVSLSQEDINLNTNEPVSAAASVSTVNAKIPVFSLLNIDVDDLEEMDLKWKMAMLTVRARRFLQRTERNLGANGPTSMGFDMSKVECYNCHRKGHFARECRSPKDTRRNGAAEPQMRNVPKRILPTMLLWPSHLQVLLLTVRFLSVNGYHVVPPPYTGTLMPPKLDLVFTNASNDVETDHPAFTDESETKTQNVPSFIHPTKQVKSPWHSVQHVETSIPTANSKTAIQKPTSNGKIRNRKACFVCKSLDHLIKDYDYHEKKMAQPTAKNHTQRGSHKHYARIPVSTAVPKFSVTRPRQAKTVVTKTNLPPKRYINRSPSLKPSNFPPKVTAVKASMVNAAQGKWEWKPKCLILDHVSRNTSASITLKRKDKRVIDSGCSRHMTGNTSYLSNFEELNGGYVTFGRNPKGSKISGKGKIRTGKLDFDDVYFVKELKFNLFSVSQMYDKKNSVLFTDTECLIFSPKFKLPDENQVLLRVPRENNMYNVNLKNIVPSRDLTCLFVKATIDESNLWHKRMGHINLKTMNKLVKGNLVRGLPSKVFENDKTCVACKKGKQHRASFKTKPISSVNQPLYRLYMDLFGPTFVQSLNKKSYCLLVIDDYSRFTWVFFLATKDETSPILKTFITGLENQLSLKVKVIRSDNGTEFKNHDLNQFYGMKGIKREFSVPRTPQQNGIAERKNKTLIEAARTILADLLLPIPFWAENTKYWFYETFWLSCDYPKYPRFLRNLSAEFEDFSDNSINEVNAASTLVPAIGNLSPNMSNTFSAAGPSNATASPKHRKSSCIDTSQYPDDPNIQDKYVAEIIRMFRLNKGKSASTLIDTEKPLLKDLDGEDVDMHTYRSMIGSLMYLTSSRPDIIIIVCACVRFQVTSKASHLHAVKKIFRYLKGKPHLGLWYPKCSPFDLVAFSDSDYAEADFNNLKTSITVSPIPTTRVHKDHPVIQITGDLSSATQTRSMTRVAKDQGGLSQINNDDFHTCMFACFLSQEEPKRVHQALKYPSWIEAMQEELLQFKMQKVWVLVDLPHGKRAIGTKWVFRNKKDERGIVVRNKARLVTQGHTQEEGIDYEEVFTLVTRIEVIRLFLAYVSFMGFMVYQMDVKSAFQYGTIKEEVYVCQPLGFEDPDYPNKVYKVVKALYGLHQAPRAWYESLANYLMKNGFQRVKIDQTLFIKRQKCDILRVNTPRFDEDRLELTELTVFLLPKVEEVGVEVSVVDLQKVIITEASIRDALRLDEAEGVECLPNEEIFAELARMGYEKPSTKLTFYKAFFLSQWTSWNEFSSSMASDVICLSTVQEVGKDVDEEHVEDVNIAGVDAEGDASDDVNTAVDEPSIPSPTPPTPPPQPSQDIPSTSQVQPTPPQSPQVQPQLPQHQPQPLQDAGISMDLLQNLMDTWGIIANINANEDDIMKDAKYVVVEKSADVDENDEESKPAELQKVVDVVTTAKIITEVVTAASTTLTVATLQLTTAAAHTLTIAPTARRRKGVVIRDPQETTTSSTIIHSKAKFKDKGKGILVEEPKPLKKQAQIKHDEKYARELEAELNKNIDSDEVIDHVQRKNVAGFKMDYFKGMTYDDIRPIFEKHFDFNVAFLQNTKEQMDEEDSRALKRLNESQEDKATKKQKLDEEVKELKRHLQIVSNDEDDVYTEATPLALKVSVVDYEIYNKNNKPYYKIKRAEGSHQLYLTIYTSSNLEKSKKCSWSSKSQELEAVGILWCADNHIYNNTVDFAGRDEISTHKKATGGRESNLYTISISDMAASSPVCLMSKETLTKSWLWHPSINRKKYILVIVDDYSRYTWVYFLHSKDETPEIIKKFIAQAQLNYKAKVCKIHTDDDIGVFIGYSETSRGFRIYNRRTKKIMETIHVKFDELTVMASKHDSLEPELQRFNNHNSSAEPMNTPSKEDLDNLFDSHSTSSITIDEHKAPPIETTSDEQTSLISLIEADELHQEDYANVDGNSHWTKDHLLNQVIGDASKPVMTRQRLHMDSEVCMYALTVSTIEPKNIKEATADHSWIESMQDELNQFERLQVWELVPRLEGMNIIALKWLWKNKCDAKNIVLWNKTRLVAKGYRQKEGIDFEESFALVAHVQAVRMFIAYDAHKNITIFQMDVKTYFLNGPLKELKKLYTVLSKHLVHDFSKCFANLMKNNFKMSMMGELKFFLGLQVHQSPRGIFISQSQYAIELLKKHGLDEYVSMSTPMATKRLDVDLQGTPTDQTTYRGMIKGLMYLTASGKLVSWSSKKQDCTAMSTAKAEYVSLSAHLDAYPTA